MTVTAVPMGQPGGISSFAHFYDSAGNLFATDSPLPLDGPAVNQS